jgi:hypothetical protein
MRSSGRSNRVAIAALSFLITSGICFAEVTVQIASDSAIAGGTGSTNISLITTSGSAPASVQWKLTYSQTDLSGMTLVPAAAVTSAGKTLACVSGAASVECIISGLNTTAIPNGIVATAQFSVPASASESSALGITGVVAASASGTVIPATGAGGTLTVAQAVQPSTLTCSPQTLITPATAICIVNLTSAPTNTVSYDPVHRRQLLHDQRDRDSVGRAKGHGGAIRLAQFDLTCEGVLDGEIVRPRYRAIRRRKHWPRSERFPLSARWPSSLRRAVWVRH